MKIRLNTKPAKKKNTKKKTNVKNVNTKNNTAKLKLYPSTQVVLRIIVIITIFGSILFATLPALLNFAPGSVAPLFKVEITDAKYTTLFFWIIVFMYLVKVIAAKMSMKDIDNWYKSKNPSKELVKKIRSQCIEFPYRFLFVGMSIPVVILIISIIVLKQQYIPLILKSSCVLAGVVLVIDLNIFLFTKKMFDDILAKTYTEHSNIGPRIGFKKRIFAMTVGVLAAAGIVTAFIGYSGTVKEKSDVLFKIYTSYFEENFNIEKTYELNEVVEKLNGIKGPQVIKSKFIMDENNEVYVLDGERPTDFAIDYMIKKLNETNGRIYEIYGRDIQGVAKQLETEDGLYYVAIMYKIDSTITIWAIIGVGLLATMLASAILYVTITFFSNRIISVTDDFKKIVDKKHKTNIVPLTTNDEIGDLIYEFNRIQKLNGDQITTIKENQNTMIEKERLASLGQMVGGIAHNLKTPIFSIAGGIEGLEDLITEFDESIEDTNVTKEDMHAIANDMKDWTEKLKGHTSYMSEVVTAVKGQAVNFSEELAVPFSVEELFGRVRVLMQHEVKHSNSVLEISNRVDDGIVMHGALNNLVQVINNLISNAIQGYGDIEKEKLVKLESRLDKNGKVIIISIKDFGPGLPKEVQEKIFKEMVTTKGKNGTGLGLYMSRSNIQAHFKGDLTYETAEGKGTTFYIKIPVK